MSWTRRRLHARVSPSVSRPAAISREAFLDSRLHVLLSTNPTPYLRFQVLFDHTGSLQKYESVMDILKEFFQLRMKYYGLRKEWLLGMLGAESAKLSNQARFILEKIQGTLVIGASPLTPKSTFLFR